MRVTVVSPFGALHGGAEQWLVSVLSRIPDISVRAILLSDGPLAGALKDIGAAVVVRPVGTGPTDIASAARFLWSDLRAHRPDVAVANGVKAMAALAFPARALRVPTVWVKHDHSFDSTLARPLGRMATTVMTTALEVGEPAGRDDLVVIEPERPPDPLDRGAALRELAARGYEPDDRLAIVSISRLVPYKGVDVGIMALAYPQTSAWRLVVIGGNDSSAPHEDRRLTELAEDVGVADRVAMLGPVPNAGVLVSAFDALAVLTRPGQAGAPDREGYGITATEAMLGGVPVVATGPGPITRRLATPDGPAGFAVPPADPLAVADAMAQLTDDPLRALMGDRGRVAAHRQPDADQVAAEFTALLRSTSARRRAGTPR